MSDVALYACLALLIGSNLFWAVVCFQLTDRLMSRNFAEYVQSKTPRKKQEPQVIDETDPDAERQAQEINSMMGIA